MKSSELGKEVIKKELPLIPKSPGVYRMLNHKDDILYVGKAKNLPNRLKSYVAEKNHIIRTERMLSQTFKIEITTTANESEALLLEANLIKKHKPKFNILLKDDKSFPFIFIGEKAQWPRVTKHRGKKDKEGFYFGPFASAGSANWTIKMIQKIFHGLPVTVAALLITVEPMIDMARTALNVNGAIATGMVTSRFLEEKKESPEKLVVEQTIEEG